MTSNQNKELMISLERMGQNQNNKSVVKLTRFKKMSSQTDLNKTQENIDINQDDMDDDNLTDIDDISDSDICDTTIKSKTSTYSDDKNSVLDDSSSLSPVRSPYQIQPRNFSSAICPSPELFKCPKCDHERRVKLQDGVICSCICHVKGKTLIVNRSSFPLDASIHMRAQEKSRTIDVIRTRVTKSPEKDRISFNHSFLDYFKSPKVFDRIPHFTILDLKSRKFMDNTTLPVIANNSRLSSRRNSTSLTLPDLKARRKSESSSYEFIRSHSARCRRSCDIYSGSKLEASLNFDLLPNKIKMPDSANSTNSSSAIVTSSVVMSCVTSKITQVNNCSKSDLQSPAKKQSMPISSVDSNNTSDPECQNKQLSQSNGEVKLRKNSASDRCNRLGDDLPKSGVLGVGVSKDIRRLSESGLPLDLSNVLQVGEDLLDASPTKTINLLMRHLEKGGTLLQEAVTGESDEGVRDLARALQLHLTQFTQRLYLTRDRLEDTARCYHLLDKAYEWALEAMKVVGRVKGEGLASPEQVGLAAKALAGYLEEHPPISEETFTSMTSLATRLNNSTLLQQCKIAQARCQETSSLLRSRHAALLKAKHQMEFDCQSYVDLNEVLAVPDDNSPLAWLSTSPLNNSGRKRSVSSIGSKPRDPLSRCASLETDDESLYNEPIQPYIPVKSPVEARSSLGGIKEVRESAEDLLSNSTTKVPEEASMPSSDATPSGGSSSSSSSCASSDRSGSISPHNSKSFMKRSNTWQYGMIPSKLHEDNSELLDHSMNSSKTMPPSSLVNSHLLIRGSQLNISMNTNDLSQEEVKKNKTLLMIMQELIQTERDYVHSLEYIIENYIPELMREDIPQALRGQRNAIFGNIEKIFEFHSVYFLRELESCEMRPFSVGSIFLKYESQFYLYALYNKNKPKSDALMSEYGSSFFKAMQLKLEDRMDLASYLLKPVQRMGKYALILKQLLKECNRGEEGYEQVITAQEMVQFQLRHGNDLLAMDSLRDCDVNLKEQGRLLRQGEFSVWEGGKARKTTRHLFLFEDLILFSKSRRDPDKKNLDIFQYKYSMKMTDIGLTQQIGESTTKFEIWFRKRKPSDTYLLQSTTAEIKDSWTKEISELLFKQALRNRTMRLHEMSSMGIGNKPCLDIRPSEDQISDRSISINQFNKAPRLRSSSITSTTDTATTPTRRPYSIISVASSSSSGSSQRSSGCPPTVGTLNLGFEPGDSPRSLHRSVTRTSQCSAESGILADMYTTETEEAAPQHKKVERSNSTITTLSVDSAFSHSTPVSSPYSTPTTPLSSIQPYYSTPVSTPTTLLHSTSTPTSCINSLSPLARRESSCEDSTSSHNSDNCSIKTLLTTEV